LSCVAQVFIERTVFITYYVQPMHLSFFTNTNQDYELTKC